MSSFVPSTTFWVEPHSWATLIVNIRLWSSSAYPSNSAALNTCYPFSSRKWALLWLALLGKAALSKPSPVDCHRKDCLRRKWFKATSAPNHICISLHNLNILFYFICFSLFPLQGGELGLRTAIPVRVLVVCQILLTAHLHVPFFLPEASMLSTKQSIIKTHAIIPAFHELIPAGYFHWSSYGFSTKSRFAPRCR